MSSQQTVDLLIGTFVSETPDTVTVTINGQPVVAIKPTPAKPVLLNVGGLVVSL